MVSDSSTFRHAYNTPFVYVAEKFGWDGLTAHLIFLFQPYIIVLAELFHFYFLVPLVSYERCVQFSRLRFAFTPMRDVDVDFRKVRNFEEGTRQSVDLRNDDRCTENIEPLTSSLYQST